MHAFAMRLLAAAAACLVANCAAAPFDSAKESCRVYSALLDSVFVKKDRPLFLLEARRPGPSYSSLGAPTDSSRGEGFVPLALWQRYLESLADSAPLLPGCIQVGTTLVWRSSVDDDALRDNRSSPETERVAHSIVRVSAVVFSADHSMALVHAWANCGSLCGGGGLYLFTRKSGRWQLRNEVFSEAS